MRSSRATAVHELLIKYPHREFENEEGMMGVMMQIICKYVTHILDKMVDFFNEV